MVEFDRRKNEYILYTSRLNIIVCAMPLFMFGVGIKLIVEMILGLDGWKTADVIGLLFVIIWTTLVFFALLFAIKETTRRIAINEDGVLCKTLISSDFLRWSEIEDWGIFYQGYTRGGEIHILYFSKEILSVTRNEKKKVKTKTIQFGISEAESHDMVSQIVDFGKTRSFIEPFVITKF